MTYIKVRSWHVLAIVTDTGWETRCGRAIAEAAQISDTLPGDEKSCESCLRYNAGDEARLDLPGTSQPSPD